MLEVKRSDGRIQIIVDVAGYLSPTELDDLRSEMVEALEEHNIEEFAKARPAMKLTYSNVYMPVTCAVSGIHTESGGLEIQLVQPPGAFVHPDIAKRADPELYEAYTALKKYMDCYGPFHADDTQTPTGYSVTVNSNSEWSYHILNKELYRTVAVAELVAMFDSLPKRDDPFFDDAGSEISFGDAPPYFPTDDDTPPYGEL